MKKIKFNQPKYVMPLLAFPFVLMMYYFGAKFFTPKKVEEVSELETVNNLNTKIPSAIVDEHKNKLNSFKEALSIKRNNSGIEGFDEEEVNSKLKNESDITKLDSIENEESNSLLSTQQRERDKLRKLTLSKINEAKKARGSSRVSNQRNSNNSKEERYKILKEKLRNRANLLAKNNKSRNSVTRNNNRGRTKLSKQAKEIDNFKKQMLFIDSMQNPQKYRLKREIKEKRIKDSIANSRQKAISKISKTNSVNSVFNTIKSNNDETFISAILDKGMKVLKGSRVRVRLLEDVYLDNRLFPKGQYLYGIVENFRQQRVLINISSIVVNDEIVPVNISLYDNDGMSGIYVPDALFQQFAQELAGSSADNLNVLGNNGQSGGDPGKNMLFQNLSSAVQNSSKALKNLVKTSKVRLKYNHKVYLVNNNTKQ